MTKCLPSLDGRGSTTPAPESLIGFEDFAARIRGRLEVGKREYGDSSFRRPMVELVGEIQEELLDVAGWAFILYSRLERLNVIGQLPE